MKFKKIILYIFIVIIPLSITGCSINQITTPVPKNYLDNIVKKYVGPEGVQPSFGGKTFYDYKIIDSEKSKNIIKIYLYYIGQEYYIEDDKLVEGTGSASFATVTIKKENNNYKLVSYEVPKSPAQEDTVKIFPKSVRKKAIHANTPSLKNIEKEAETYF
ncbi:hypothetical protein EXN36_19100, partial [Clostridium botulinum]|nr:hypothetical protein [Clostridium botulinum]